MPGRIAAALQRCWWQRDKTALAWALLPLSWLYAGFAAASQLPYTYGWRRPARALVPTIVVGNLIVGGAGKTPTVIALVRALQREGCRPGVIARGYGRRGAGTRAVQAGAGAPEVGDEPLLISRRTGVPVWVSRQRVAAARALCAAHPDVDVLVADDGLQHQALARDAELIVFDDRGAGNGLLLPAGPLRQRLPAALLPHTWVLYNASAASTALPGMLVQRRLGDAVPLASWQRGSAEGSQPLQALAGRDLLALAGIAAPERFFAMLRAAGLQARTLRTLALPDHYPFDTLPWLAHEADVLVTEKDAVKLADKAVGRTRVWVIGLDFVLPPPLVQALLARLRPP